MHRNGRGRCTSDGLCRWIERKPRTPPRPLVRVRLIAASTHLSFLVRLLPAHSITSSTRISTTAGGGAGGLVQCGRASSLPPPIPDQQWLPTPTGCMGVNWARTLARCGPQKSCVALESLEACQRAFLVALHHRGEADHVSGKDRGEAAGGHSGTRAFMISQPQPSYGRARRRQVCYLCHTPRRAALALFSA